MNIRHASSLNGNMDKSISHYADLNSLLLTGILMTFGLSTSVMIQFKGLLSKYTIKKPLTFLLSHHYRIPYTGKWV